MITVPDSKFVGLLIEKKSWQMDYFQGRPVYSMLTPEEEDDGKNGVCCKYIHAAVNKNRSPVNAVEWLHNGRRLLTGNQLGEFTLWNGKTFTFENMFQAHPCPIRTFHWMRDGSTLLSGDADGIIKFWDSNFYPFVTFQAHKEAIRDITSSPNGSKFATCADEPHAKIWDFRTGQEERLLRGHGWDIKTAEWHPTKALVATGSKDCSIKIWDPRANEAIATIYCHKSVVTRIRWSPDGQWLATGSRDQLVKILDVRKMAVQGRVFKQHTKEITALAWHPTDSGILTSGSYDGHMCFWDVNNTVEPVVSIIGAHEGAIWSMAYHPLGNMLVTGSHDNSAKFWTRHRLASDIHPQELLPKGRAYMMYMQQQQGGSGGVIPGLPGAAGAMPSLAALPILPPTAPPGILPAMGMGPPGTVPPVPPPHLVPPPGPPPAGLPYPPPHSGQHGQW